MSCNFCRDSIEGLKEVEIPSKKNAPLTFSSIPQGSGGLTISPDFAGIGSKSRLYQCQWCTEYWHKKLRLKIAKEATDIEIFGAGLEFNFIEEAIPMGYDLNKINI